jgi:hypothetical protein
LFLGVMDQYQWSDNEGSFTVQLAKAASAPAVQLPLHPSSNPTDADAVANPARAGATPDTSPAATSPEIHAFTAIELVWPSEPGRLYQVQWTPSLDPPQWANLGPSVSATGTNISVFDSTRSHPQGFYRVQILP